MFSSHLSSFKDGLRQIGAVKVHALKICIAQVCPVELGVFAEGSK